MSSFRSRKSGVVNLGSWRNPRVDDDAESAAAIADERVELEEQRKRLDLDRDSFEADLSVLEEQRHFLAAQREKAREANLSLEISRRELDAERAAVAARALELACVEGLLDQARRQLEKEREQVHAEMARILAAGVTGGHENRLSA